MKIIISHDIDHISVHEHLFKDGIVTKFIIRNVIELILFRISLKEYFLRWANLFKNKWQNIDELMKFDKNHQIPSTFFLGVNKGKKLNYNNTQAEYWAKRIIQNNFDLGVHGIAFSSEELIYKEFEYFSRISGSEKFGIRMHYLRNDSETLRNLDNAGYLFDSTIYAADDPYQIGNMWEFPLHFMDGYEIDCKKRWQQKNLETALKDTIQRIEETEKKNLKYLTILFHDRYFDSSFKTWKGWYTGIIDWLEKNNYEFISFTDAIKELNK